ncbi:sensor histidine kinase [Streptomyces aidingensis]|uniref:histidine kinase n=1 Tax=Streptomyces aidingensis TaxID=910347 RepID=A0A1I1UYD4_9ACTN|nr:HAMP domain-containing sensor histidine kinase [Streptomyces aidingensis]SFD75796.1 two-component system, OmpR family, sensor kinase [Streptomyces aidingensis]
MTAGPPHPSRPRRPRLRRLRSWRPRPWRRWTLRARLVAVTVALSALAVTVAGGAGVVLLRGYLTDRVDEELAAESSAAGRFVFLMELQQLLLPEGEPTLLEQLLADRYGERSRIHLHPADGGEPLVFPSGMAGSGPDLPDRAVLAERSGKPFTAPDIGSGGHSWRVHSTALVSGQILVTAVSLDQVESTVNRLAVIAAGVAAAVLLVLAALAAVLVRLGLRPLTRMAATSGEIAAGDFTRRVADADPHTEPGRLGRAMNAVLARVEWEFAARRASEERLRQFLADASHELRTPLTSIRGFAELARRGGDPGAALARIEAEAARMGVLVEDLLVLARLDRQRPVEHRPVELRELAADLIRDAHGRHPDRTLRLTGLDGGGAGRPAARPDPVTVLGDPLRLRQVVGNLLANALTHTPADAGITLRVGCADAAAASAAGRPLAAVGELAAPPDAAAARTATPVAVLEVADTGPGIPPKDARHVFERFYRAGPARDGGTGLGLAIAAALTEAHRGRIELRPGDGGGAVFRLLLPLPAPPAPPAPGGDTAACSQLVPR